MADRGGGPNGVPSAIRSNGRDRIGHSERLLYLSDSRVPSNRANSIQVMRTCEALAELGVMVTLFAENGETLTEPAHAAYGCRANFTIRRYPDLTNIRDRFGRHAFKLARYAQTRLFASTLDFQLAPTVVYARHPNHMWAYLTEWHPRRPNTIIELHTPPRTPAIAATLENCLNMAEGLGIVTISEHLRQHTLATFPQIPPSRVVTIHDAATVPVLMARITRTRAGVPRRLRWQPLQRLWPRGARGGRAGPRSCHLARARWHGRRGGRLASLLRGSAYTLSRLGTARRDPGEAGLVRCAGRTLPARRRRCWRRGESGMDVAAQTFRIHGRRQAHLMLGSSGVAGDFTPRIDGAAPSPTRSASVARRLA